MDRTQGTVRRPDKAPVEVSHLSAPVQDLMELALEAGTFEESAVNRLPVGVMTLSANGLVVHLNPVGLSLIEADSLAQIVGKQFLHLVAPEFRSAFAAMFQRVVSGRSDSLEYQVTGFRGSRKWFKTYASPEPGAVAPCLLAVLLDTTERVQREGKDRYHHKMDAIATLTSGIAHDFNNILTSIVGYANVLKIKLPPDDPLGQLAAQIIAASDRASALTKSLLSFGSRQILTLSEVPVVDLVQSALAAAAGDLDGCCQVTFADGAPAGTAVRIDRAQMEQALRHIVLNARDAMPSGGTLGVTTGVAELEDTFISIHGYGVKGRYAVITFTDSGAGMSEETRRKAFEPFFTTKEVGKGLGLGLAIVYGTVKSHQGFANIYSEPGIGTTFRVYLPVSEREHRLLVQDHEAVPSAKGETVLLADDDAGIRDVMTAILQQFGYTVIPVATGEDAVEAFRVSPGTIDLAILDALLPKMSGAAAWEEILCIRRDAKVIFTSGHTPDLLRSKGLIREGAPFLTKPVSPRTLLQTIREVLAR